MFNAQKLEKWYPGSTNGNRINDLQAIINDLEVQKRSLYKRLETIDQESIYESDWEQPVEILKRTERQVQVKPRYEGDKPIVLNRTKLDTKGEYFYRRRHRMYYSGTEIMRRLMERISEIMFAVRRFYNHLMQIEDNWLSHGLAVTHEEMVVAVDIFGFRKRETEVNWLKEGF